MSGSSPPPAGDNSGTLTGVYSGLELSPDSLIAGRYRIERLLGMGGMGLVYRAHDLALGVPVALKLLRPELAQRADAFDRFRTEILLARQVSSPRVVRIHDIVSHEGRWLISMDLVEGEGLDRLIDREGALPIEQVIGLGLELAEALQAAHSSGVVHRDLKPANVLLDAAGRAHVSDFGVARSLGSSGLTQSGMIVGTPDYLAPEQARGGVIDGRADLYALGLILYEMLAGRRAFDASTAAEALARKLAATPPPIERLRSDTPAWLARLVMRLLRIEPSQRLPDAAAVLAVLKSRRLAPRLAWSSRAVLKTTALLATLAAALWLGGRLLAPAWAPPSVPDRWMVVASGAQASDASAAEGLAEHLRQAIELMPAPVVASGQRTALALAQSGIGVIGPASPERLQALPARRLLLLRLNTLTDGRVQLQVDWHGNETPRAVLDIEAADALTAARELQAALAVPGSVLAGLPDLLPDSADALSRFAQALGQLRQGRIEDAVLELDAASMHPLSHWLAADSLRRSGRREAALRRLQAQPSGGLLTSRSRAWQAALEGAPEALRADLSARLERQPDDLEAALRLAELEIDAGHFEAAIIHAEAICERDAGDARAWFLLGKATLLKGDPRRAVEDHLLRALVGFKRARDLRGEAETANALGIGYARLGQIDAASEQYRKGLALRRELSDRRGTASSLHNLAQLALLRGELEQAGELLEESGLLFAAVGDHAGGAAVENESGLLHEERGDYAQALEAYRRALRSRQLAEDPAGVAESLNNLAYSHYQLGDYDNAEALWRQSGEGFERIDDANGRIRVQQNLGLLETARGRWSDARERLQQSLDEAERRQLFEEAAVSHRNLAELALLQGDRAAAERSIEQAEQLFSARGDQRGQVDAALLNIRLTAALGDVERARAQLAEASPRWLDASTEQRALAALLEAELSEPSDPQASAAALRAAELADDAGIERLRLSAALQALRLNAGEASDRAAPAELQARIAALGDLPLQLRLLQWELQDAPPEVAVAAYQRMRMQLPARSPQVASIHALAADALQALGRGREADDARAAAQAAGNAAEGSD